MHTISAHEARTKSLRSKDADLAYAAVTAVLKHACARIDAASERGATSTMFTVMPELHGFNGAHAARAAREIAITLLRKGFDVTRITPTELHISWTERKPAHTSKRRDPRAPQVAPEDAWRFELRQSSNAHATHAA